MSLDKIDDCVLPVGIGFFDDQNSRFGSRAQRTISVQNDPLMLSSSFRTISHRLRFHLQDLGLQVSRKEVYKVDHADLVNDTLVSCLQHGVQFARPVHELR